MVEMSVGEEDSVDALKLDRAPADVERDARRVNAKPRSASSARDTPDDRQLTQRQLATVTPPTALQISR